MKSAKNIALGCIVLSILFCFSLAALGAEPAADGYPPSKTGGLTQTQITRIEKFIVKQMRLGKIPGMAVAVVKDDQVVYKRGFGFADIRRNQPVTPQTLFELGSTSKAFTALGILYLAENGLLDIHDPVNKYIPWFKMKQRKRLADPTLENLNRRVPWFYATQDIDITIEQLLHHTSGITPGTIADIPSSAASNSLEKAVRILMKKAIKPQMDYYPGERYIYATINYDILGLIITKVSGQPYEDFMKDHILDPLGLNHTVLFRDQAGPNLATGYKVGFLRPLEYNAPVYRGNTPAGYIITSADDMSQWLKVQLGTATIDPFYRQIVDRTHRDEYDYSNGWNINRMSDRIKFSHGGSNPNYSSYIEFWTPEKLGIILLFNNNSGFAGGIGAGIINIIHGRGRIPERLYDMYVDYDEISCLVILVMAIIIGLSIRFIMERYRLYPKYKGVGGKNSLKFLVVFSLLIVLGTVCYFLPEIIFGYHWGFLAVWGPVTLLIAFALVFGEILIGYLYLLNVYFFESKDQKTRVKVKKSLRRTGR